MTTRDAKRPLAGVVGSHEPEILRGRYTTDQYERMVRVKTPAGWITVDLGGTPAVSVNLQGGRSGTRTFNEANQLRELADELIEAAAWLAREQRLHLEREMGLE